MSGEVTDFKNTEYRKIRIDVRTKTWAGDAMDAVRGWEMEVDDEWARWCRFRLNACDYHLREGRDPIFILTFHRPRKIT